MKDILRTWFTRINAFLIRISKGRIGSRLGTQSILVLHTTGRKSGQWRTTPVAYFERDGRYLLVGSNWAKPAEADWVLNLRHNPRARIDVKGQSFDVLAREAQGDEYGRLWQYVSTEHPPYLQYQRTISRRIPIMVLERAR